MKREIKELKRIARMNLKGNYLHMIRMFIFCNVIIYLLEMPFSMMTNEVEFSMPNMIYYIAAALIGIASVVLTGGQYRIHLGLARTDGIHLSELFYPAKHHANRYIFTELILSGISLITMLPMFGGLFLIYTAQGIMDYFIAFLLSIISVILGVYISLTFDLVYFAMNDREDLSMMEALKYTKELVTTHRKRYLYMQLSFLGMLLLVGLSFGIGLLWVQPYMVQTTTLFYLDVKGELDEVMENKQNRGHSPEPMAFNQYI